MRMFTKICVCTVRSSFHAAGDKSKGYYVYESASAGFVCISYPNSVADPEAAAGPEVPADVQQLRRERENMV